MTDRQYWLGSIVGDAYVAGQREGEARGEARGEEKMARLMNALMTDGRTDLALRVVNDLALRADLYRQYGIE